MRPALRFVAERGVWHGHLEEEDLDLVVAGDAAGPDPGLADIFWRIVDDFPACKRAVETFTTGLPADTPIVLLPRGDSWFSAGQCGFAAGGNDYVVLSVSSRRPTLSFCTGYPDGYALFEVVLDGIQPIAITAGCW